MSVFRDERSLLAGVEDFATRTIDGDRHYLTAYHGEVWKGGFDLPFLRQACARRDVEWPFPDVAYADTMDMVDHFYTNDVLIDQQKAYTSKLDTTDMNLIAGVILFSVGLLGFLWPAKTLRFWFLGMLSEDAITERGYTFFRVLGGVCAVVGLGIAILG